MKVASCKRVTEARQPWRRQCLVSRMMRQCVLILNCCYATAAASSIFSARTQWCRVVQHSVVTDRPKHVRMLCGSRLAATCAVLCVAHLSISSSISSMPCRTSLRCRSHRAETYARRAALIKQAERIHAQTAAAAAPRVRFALSKKQR